MTNNSIHLRYLTPVLFGLLAACGGGGGGGSGSGTVTASAGTLQIAETAYDAAEGMVVNIRVARSGGSAGVASVAYASTNGTAEANSDYAAANGTLTWNDGVSGNRTISIPITDDNLAEGPESFTVTLRNASGATLGAISSTTVNIIDNDTAAVAAFGAISALDSITVNGIHYNTNGTVVNVNGVPAGISDLKMGQLVALAGEVNFSNATGIADEIDYSASVIGPVENIDPALKQLIIMGQTIWTNADTVFDTSIDPDTFAGLAEGANAQISGYRNADGELVATRIEPDSTSSGVQLIGAVDGLDLANMLFTVNRLTIDYSNAVLVDLPAGMPANGLRVLVRGSLQDGILVVTEITEFHGVSATLGVRIHLGGIVTRFASSFDFDLNGIRVTIDSATRFVNGIFGDLQANANITVNGEFGGGWLSAGEVTFGPPVTDTTSSTYDFDNFTNINVAGLSRVTLVQGSDFSVQVSTASSIFDDVQVTQSGETLMLGNDNTLMLNAVVTMPALNRLDVAAGSLAHVSILDFDQQQMTVNVGGVSVVQGEGLQIGSLTAMVSGVSALDLGRISPIGGANIDISGVSRATLNMEVGSSLTGSVRTGQGTGVSTLYYYGTNVNTGVTTDALSRVVQLGDSKP